MPAYISNFYTNVASFFLLATKTDFFFQSDVFLLFFFPVFLPVPLEKFFSIYLFLDFRCSIPIYI